MKTRTERLKDALWGLFIADAVAMPVHWYYERANIPIDYPGAIQGFEAPRHPHPESFMAGMGYYPDVEMAKKLGRPYDILHQHKRFYSTSYSTLQIKTVEHDGEHGNKMPTREQRFHYHHGLQKGENTLGAQLVRVLMRSIIDNQGYDQGHFIDRFVSYMTTAGQNRDPYCEIYIRKWFENYSRGQPGFACAEQQREIWSIGSHGGMIRPMVLALMAKSPFEATGLALSHQQITHRSENVSAALHVTVPLLLELLGSEDPMTALNDAAVSIQKIQIRGDELTQTYSDHYGPGNIPSQRMWDIHTCYSDENVDLEQIDPGDAIGGLFATACYPEHGLPLLMHFLHKHQFDFEKAVFENANAGGDNVHRGMVLGLLAGAIGEVPEVLKQGLFEYDQLADEIDRFVDVAQ